MCADNDTVPEVSFCKWFNLDTRDIETLANDIVKAYTAIQDKSDGAMFPGELKNLIMQIARTNSDDMLDVCDGTCIGYCKCTLPQPYTQAHDS